MITYQLLASVFTDISFILLRYFGPKCNDFRKQKNRFTQKYMFVDENLSLFISESFTLLSREACMILEEN